MVEAVESYNLIINLSSNGKLNQYYDVQNETLEHFRFKERFIRKNKKVLISFVPEQLIELVCRERKVTFWQICNSVKRKRLRLRFGDIREYYATFMTKFLSQPEIDFLQGRASGSVFMSNYFNPALIGDLRNRVFKAIREITGNI